MATSNRPTTSVQGIASNGQQCIPTKGQALRGGNWIQRHTKVARASTHPGGGPASLGTRTGLSVNRALLDQGYPLINPKPILNHLTGLKQCPYIKVVFRAMVKPWLPQRRSLLGSYIIFIKKDTSAPHLGMLGSRGAADRATTHRESLVYIQTHMYNNITYTVKLSFIW